MSHEPLTIDNYLIHELFDYILQASCIKHHPRIPIPTPTFVAPHVRKNLSDTPTEFRKEKPADEGRPPVRASGRRPPPTAATFQNRRPPPMTAPNGGHTPKAASHVVFPNMRRHADCWLALKIFLRLLVKFC